LGGWFQAEISNSETSSDTFRLPFGEGSLGQGVCKNLDELAITCN